MSIDLLALLQEKVGGALNNFASSQLGESPSMASKAVSLILPALLGKLAGQTGDASRMTQLFNLVTRLAGRNRMAGNFALRRNLAASGRRRVRRSGCGVRILAWVHVANQVVRATCLRRSREPLRSAGNGPLCLQCCRSARQRRPRRRHPTTGAGRNAGRPAS